MTAYTVDTVIEAPRQLVYDIFADRENNGNFLPVQTRLETPGTVERQGVGAVHFLGIGPVGVREQITELVPGQRISYKVVGGVPVKSHTGQIEFSDAGTGTRVVYTMDSEPKLPVPEPVLRAGLKALITTFVNGAKKEATRKANS
ncbi:SRPBCC family protein [Skermania sp. ID1734]|uniref:SRPBCC family protein n=1 Tax=Skermania sp. ID1734 TaxID=2597516 RepID=UPI00117C91DE|nr:SRPBCC family protein [Skermania sp. ID1734]TSE01387.1 SRPBCC family protein [Skermania sp. ID1734]